MRRSALATAAVVALGASAFAAAPALATPGDAFHRTATYPVYLNVPEGMDPADETVAEISTVTPDGQTLVYTDAAGKRIGFVDLSDPNAPAGLGTVSLASLGHADDQPTSVAVAGDYVLVVIDETGGAFTEPKGRVDVLRIADRERVASIDLKGQPDSIAVSKDGAYATIAIENQRDEDAGDGGLPQLPGGFLQVIELAGTPDAWTADPVPFVQHDGQALPSFVAAGLDTPEDPEPEYVSINGRNEVAVTLQENNGVVIVDLATREIERVFSAGTVDLTGIDATKDGELVADDSLNDVPREPDAVGWVDDDHLATANEGDWKGGSRGWTVFSASGDVVWDAGNSFEHIAMRYSLANEDRAAKKGSEPEGLAIAEFDGVPYAFVASERSNFVAVYDVSDPAAPVFSQILFTTNGPEGVLPIPSRGLLAVSSETDDAKAGVRSAVNVYQLGAGTPSQPSIESADVDGTPIGWTALGALSADPVDANTLYSATDAALATSRLYTIDVSSAPAVITSTIPVTKDGAAATYDVEGVFKRPQGGFWLASEGATGPENRVVRTDDAGVVQEEIALPEDVSSHIGKWGLEGVTATTDADGRELVYVAVQRPLWVDPAASPLEPLEGASTTRIGQYDVAAGTWNWFGYELESTSTSGDWLGLSEIVAVDEDTLAVIERDKLNGPNAAIKRIYTIDVPATGSGETRDALTVLPKTLALDVLPELQATNGWTQEKLEGLTIGADGRVFAVTDNDGLDDATGETVFLRLGTSEELFGASTTPEPTTTGTPGATDGAGTPAPSTPTTAGTDGALASTGADGVPWVMLAIAAAAALAGATALTLRHRRTLHRRG
ncbi:esterase-like activity of phytase family protein [Pseudoclavibacter chungangensis]|uniref:Esterase-like activity of phytase family protein n=1 Tax=Pseudoclavibacter chungangensis TaxID=587635 RepID=A0A7J5BUN5_9MICO|nr:esterase-like activity of phytase family protein [Pseudoclavibacter chungangensis]